MSIVTPVRNGVRFFEEHRRGVEGQDYPAIEHVVVDGGSTDGTLELLERTPGIRFTSEPDGGMYDAINKGLRLARGEILGLQNADDRYVVPGAVRAAVLELLADPELDGVYGDFRFVDEAGRTLSTRRVGARSFGFDQLRRFNFVPSHSTFVRRRTLEKGHWLDPTLQFAGDWEWVLGMARAGRRLRHLDAILSEFRVHPRSKSQLVPLRERVREYRRICERYGTSLALLLWYECLYVPLRRRLGLGI